MGLETTTPATFLARLAREGDPRVWQEFCDRYGALVRGFAYRQGLQPADCDDILQDVLLSLSKSMPGFRYDPAKGKFRSYLKTVVLHAVYARKAQKRRGVGLVEIEEVAVPAGVDPEADQAWEAEWRQYHLRQAMRRIELEFSRKELAAFELYAIAGQSAQDAAAMLSLSLDQVYQAKSRILPRLCQIIAEQSKDEG